MNTSSLWRSKWYFVLATIGAAAGLGNLWRFPYMVYDNGGAAFILAYLIIMLGFVYFFLVSEAALGQFTRQEITGALTRIGGKWGRWVGLFLVGNMMLLAAYYASVIGWTWDYLYHSFSLSWGTDPQTFFFGQILQLSDDPTTVGSYVTPVVLGLIATYIAVYFSLFKGIKSVENVVAITVPLPIILLVVLFINAFFLPGSSDGFAYLLTPDFTQLTSLSLWRDAFSQAFFSANVGLAITVLHATYNAKDTDITGTMKWVLGGDLLVSLISAGVVFGTLGFMAQSQGTPLTEVVQSGVVLTFVTIPAALSAFPIFPALFAVLFFVTILTLAIDSMFAIIETIIASAKANFPFLSWFSTSTRVALFCGLFCLASLAYATQNGLFRLDTTDHFVFGHGVLIAAFFQSLLIGWGYPAARLRQQFNAVSRFQLGAVYDFVMKFVAPLLIAVLYVAGLRDDLTANYEGYPTELLLSWGVYPLVGIFVVSGLIAWFTQLETDDPIRVIEA